MKIPLRGKFFTVNLNSNSFKGAGFVAHKPDSVMKYIYVN
jgi:hypothetical protein